MEIYFEHPPELHTWDNGLSWNTGGFSGEMLRSLYSIVGTTYGAGSRILETGAGNSTIALMLTNPSELVSIAPDQELFGRIRTYCGRNTIPLETWSPINNISEIALPMLAMQRWESNSWFDVALIDGGHGWPTVFVDFCYSLSILRMGGILIIDDVQLYSIKELVRFLKEDGKFAMIASWGGGKTLVFEKKFSRRFLDDFGAQPYIIRRSKEDSGTRL